MKRYIKIKRRHTIHKIAIKDIICCGCSQAPSSDVFAFVTRLRDLSGGGGGGGDSRKQLTCFAYKSKGVNAEKINDLIVKYDPALGPELGGFSREDLFGEGGANCLREVLDCSDKKGHEGCDRSHCCALEW